MCVRRDRKEGQTLSKSEQTQAESMGWDSTLALSKLSLCCSSPGQCSERALTWEFNTPGFKFLSARFLTLSQSLSLGLPDPV